MTERILDYAHTLPKEEAAIQHNLHVAITRVGNILIELVNQYKTFEDDLRMMRETEAYADRLAAKNESLPSKSYLQAGFEHYKKNPQKWNPGQSNYVELVNKRANEVWNSPEIQNWYKIYRKRSLENGGKIDIDF